MNLNTTFYKAVVLICLLAVGVGVLANTVLSAHQSKMAMNAVTAMQRGDELQARSTFHHTRDAYREAVRTTSRMDHRINQGYIVYKTESIPLIAAAVTAADLAIAAASSYIAEAEATLAVLEAGGIGDSSYAVDVRDQVSDARWLERAAKRDRNDHQQWLNRSMGR